MKRATRLSPHAARDLLRVVSFLNTRNPDASRRALQAIEEAVRSLETLGERGRPGARENQRELLVPFGRDGYVIRYTLSLSLVVVTRIFHGRERR